jgi:hypothetical protein
VSSPNRPILIAILPFFVLTIAFGALSDSVHHDDDLTHYLMARWSSYYPSYLLHIWGRPGLTAPLATVAWIGDREAGWHMARLLSAGVTAASALLAAQVARGLGIRPPWLVAVVCYLQPLATVLGFTTLTENYAALYLIVAIALLDKHRPLLASTAFSMILVTRHEALVFLPLWWLAIYQQSRPNIWISAALSLAAPVLHNLLFFGAYREWPIRIFAQAGGSTQYPGAGLLAYVPEALSAVSPAIAGLALIGAAAMLRRRQWLIPAMAAIFFLAQAAIKSLGVYASGGFGRFMVVVAPLIAILAVMGLDDVATRIRDRRSVGVSSVLFGLVWIIGLFAIEQRRITGLLRWHEQTYWLVRGTVASVLLLVLTHWAITRRGGDGRRRWATGGLAAILAITCLIHAALVVRPLRLGPAQLIVRDAKSWLAKQGLAESPIFATDPWFAYFFDLVEDPRAHKDSMLLASMPVGTIFVWDSLYGSSDFHRLRASTFDHDPHYELLNVLRVTDQSPIELRIYRKTGATPMPTTQEVFYPPQTEGREPVRGIFYQRAKR